ncbi:hypothetical protein [Jeotgalibacillus aurantiacus]|uniref:hypothetical protein n=1 Tax=Jeotgalibacillus aurantiacus TaxID=2763266 RepID=UPI001D09D96A|nr:hypothetical protein [Jeotgalibacillus aurantiacus]
MEILSKIGAHTVCITSSDDALIAECKSLFSFNQVRPKRADLHINLIRGVEKPFTSYQVQVSKNDKGVVYNREDFYIITDEHYEKASITVHNSLALKHSIMTLFSGLITHQEWGILLHSSCVLEGEAAHIFTGRSGAGKSTAAQLSAPRPLLSDEASIIRVDPEKGVVVYHSPFRSEMMESGGEGPFKLESLNLLHQSLDNRRSKMGKAEAFLLLMDKVFYWSMNKKDVQIISKILQQVIQNTDVYHLHFKKDPTFWEMMSS